MEVERSTTVHIFLCFTQTLCVNNVIAMFLLVSCTRNLLLHVLRQVLSILICAWSTPKKAKKNLEQRTLPGFITIFTLLIMVSRKIWKDKSSTTLLNSKLPDLTELSTSFQDETKQC